jgi:hypothetical protein
MNEELYARDGHPSMLSLDRYDAGELDGAARHGLELHVEGCARCRERLAAVLHPSLVPLPRTDVGRSTGSATLAYLVASTAVAMAASAVLWLGAPVWPSPHTAQQSIAEPTHMASSYTSVAQDYSEGSGLELELTFARTAGGETLTVVPRGEGWLAVVAIDGELDEGDTDGGAEPEITAVLEGPRAARELTVALPRRIGSRRTVAVLCPAPFTLEPGDLLVPEPGCIARERE